MKKFLDTPETLLEQSLLGFAQAHAELIDYQSAPRFIRRKQSRPGKVVLISGGGSGHEPLHAGLVGTGMLDAACPGQIFTSPTPDQMLAAAESFPEHGGVLFIVKNYAGDVMNFELAAEMLDCANATVLIADDVALPKDHPTGRRGVAGTLIVEKIVGAAAEAGLDLAQCQALGQKAADATASTGVALTSCTVPAIGKPTFELGETEMELGVGIHGEHGRETVAMTTASEIVARLGEKVFEALEPSKNQPILLHINGFGATPLIELYAVYHLAARFFEQRGLVIQRSLVGNYTTSLDMAGCSITVTRLDEDLLRRWDAPVRTAALNW